MLITRILSSLILLPPVILAIYFAYPWYEILIAIAVVILAWEWDKMLSSRLTIYSLITSATAIMAMLVGTEYYFGYIFLAIVIFIMFVGFFKAKKNKEQYPFLKTLGMPYITAFAMAAVYLEENFGSQLVFWLIAIVWATDTGGLVFGKTIGGPKLWVSVSPKKTWAGFFGGIFSALIVSFAVAIIFNLSLWVLLLTTTVIALLAQIGDLLESKIKRIVGVKDSSSLIPGHGGLFDRLDSLMLVMIVVAVIIMFTGGATF